MRLQTVCIFTQNQIIMQNNILECFGTITKVEEVQTLDKAVKQNTLVFETVKPFSGYYSHTPEYTSPQTIFLILNADYSAYTINHATQKIKNNLGIDFDAAKANFSVNYENYVCIRIISIDDYAQIALIQEGYSTGGITMHAYSNIPRERAAISIQKVFLLEEFKEGLYMNRGKSPMAYFELPKALSSIQFKDLLSHVNSNWDGSCFDAAQGILYRRKGIVDIVRIYTPDISKDLLEKIASLFIRHLGQH